MAASWGWMVLVVGVAVAVVRGLHWAVLDFVIDRLGSPDGPPPDGAASGTTATPPA